MSREFFFIYSVDQTDERLKLWDEFFESDHKGIMSERICNGGGVDGATVDHWIFCNKTKARYIAEKLNKYYSTRGKLTKSTYVKKINDFIDEPFEY